MAAKFCRCRDSRHHVCAVWRGRIGVLAAVMRPRKKRPFHERLDSTIKCDSVNNKELNISRGRHAVVGINTQRSTISGCGVFCHYGIRRYWKWYVHWLHLAEAQREKWARTCISMQRNYFCVCIYVSWRDKYESCAAPDIMWPESLVSVKRAKPARRAPAHSRLLNYFQGT